MILRIPSEGTMSIMLYEKCLPLLFYILEYAADCVLQRSWLDNSS